MGEAEKPLLDIGKIYRFQASNYPDKMFRHKGFKIWIDKANVNAQFYVKDSSWKIVAGLSGQGISFQSVNYPTRYLRHSWGKCQIDKYKNSALFKKDASWIVHPGLIGKGVSFESVNYRGDYMRHAANRVRKDKYQNKELFKKDATWLPVMVEAEKPLLDIGKIYRFKASNYPDKMFRHKGFNIWTDRSNVNAQFYVKDSSWKIVAGLSGQGISFQSVNYPTHYLRHSWGKCKIDKYQNSALFKKDASWIVHPGLIGNGVSFESVNYRGHYMRHAANRVRKDKYQNNALFKKDASWLPVLA